MSRFGEVLKWIKFRDKFVLDAAAKNGGKINCCYCDTELLIKTGLRKKGEGKTPANLATVDHYLPKFLGGDEYDLNNLRIACYRCNSCKGSLTPEEWESNREELIKGFRTKQRDKQVFNHPSLPPFEDIANEVFAGKREIFNFDIKPVHLDHEHCVKIYKDNIVVNASNRSTLLTLNRIFNFMVDIAPLIPKPKNTKVRGKIVFAGDNPLLIIKRASGKLLFYFENGNLKTEITKELGNRLSEMQEEEILQKT